MCRLRNGGHFCLGFNVLIGLRDPTLRNVATDLSPAYRPSATLSSSGLSLVVYVFCKLEWENL